jgi:hypothetical protein
MRKLSIISLAIVVILFFAGLFYYYKLGGFNPPDIKITNAPQYIIAGKPYKGKMTTKEFGMLFSDAEKLVEKKELEGVVCGVFYNNPEKENDTIDAFVGLVVKDSIEVLPSGYSYRFVKARKVVQAHIKSHLLVSPSIYIDIQDFAKENNVELTHVPAVEIYPSNKELLIEVPLK